MLKSFFYSNLLLMVKLVMILGNRIQTFYPLCFWLSWETSIALLDRQEPNVITSADTEDGPCRANWKSLLVQVSENKRVELEIPVKTSFINTTSRKSLYEEQRHRYRLSLGQQIWTHRGFGVEHLQPSPWRKGSIKYTKTAQNMTRSRWPSHC